MDGLPPEIRPVAPSTPLFRLQPDGGGRNCFENIRSHQRLEEDPQRRTAFSLD
jgi:hypothetical protein